MRMRRLILAPSAFLLLLVYNGVTGGTVGDEVSFSLGSSTADLYLTTLMALEELGGPRCRNQTRDFLRDLGNLTLWAVQMFDAGAKFPGGFISGNYYRLGDFDECISTKGYGQDGKNIAGQYCLATVKLKEEDGAKRYRHSKNPQSTNDLYSIEHNPMDSAWNAIEYKGDISKHRRDIVRWAFCLPSSCAAKDLEAALNLTLKQAGTPLGIQAKAFIDPSLCTVYEPMKWSGFDFTFCTLMFLLIVLCVISSIWDKKLDLKDEEYRKNLGTLSQIILCFSVRKNFKNLPRKKENTGGLNVMFGLRFISMSFIILCHVLLNVIQGPLMNPEMVEKGNRNPFYMWFLHGDLVVDTFFTSSAFLLSYFLLLELEKHKISTFKLIFFRYIRLTPTVLFVAFFYASVLEKIGSGPFWNMTMRREKEACQENWWTNILYINNYVNPDKMCILQTWYLPCDTHFFILGILLLQLIHLHHHIGVIIMVCATIVSIIIPAAITYTWSLDGTLLFYLESFLNNLTLDNKLLYDVYYPSHSRAGPYMAGLIAGYLHHQLNLSEKKLSRVVYYAMFFIGILLTSGPIYYAALFYIPGRPYYPIEAAIFAGLNRFLWGAGVATLIISMSSGQLGFLSRIFSHKMFIVLGKLTYSAYLCHFVFQLTSMGSRRNPVYMTYFNMFSLWLVNVTVTYLASLLLYLMIECPFRDLAILTTNKKIKKIGMKGENV